MPKKGSPEFIELQKRLAERKNKEMNLAETVDEIRYDEKMSTGFKYMLWGSTLPLTYGMYQLVGSAPESLALSLGFTGSWVAFSGLLLKGADLGLEGFFYSKPNYSLPKNYIFTGKLRVYSCFAHIPMSMLCIWSCMNQSLAGLCFFFIYQQFLMISSIKSGNESLTPAWYSTGHWMYLSYSQIAVMVMIYAIFSKSEEPNLFDELIKDN